MVVRSFPFVAWLFAFLAVSTCSMAVEWYVDAGVGESGDGRTWETAFQKIQEGVEAAAEGDTVLVAEGTYVENIELKGENITLRSEYPMDPEVVGDTVIDGGGVGTGISFSGDEEDTYAISGFTIRNGNSQG